MNKLVDAELGKKYDNEISGDRNLSDFDGEIIEAHEKGESILSLHTEFETFDPIVGDVPHFDLANVTRRARKLLQDRSRQEIQYAVMVAEDATSRALIDPGQISDHLTPQELGEKLGLTDEFRPRLLFRRRNLIDIRNLEDLPKAKWYEIFAALALAYVARSVNRGISASMEAMESIGYAESLALKSKANKASKTADSHWRAKAIDYAQMHDSYTASGTAKKFVMKFSGEMIKDRCKPYSEATVAKWIRSFRKSSRTK